MIKLDGRTALAILQADSRDEADWVEILRQAAVQSNSVETHDAARELVIRVLAKGEEFPAKFRSLLNSLIKSVGLIPYLTEVEDFTDAMLLGAHEAPQLVGKRFHSLQLIVYRQIMESRNVVLSATTSVGKSMIIDAVIASQKFRRIVIIVPTIALIDETRKRLTGQFFDQFSIITHASQNAPSGANAIYILTQERVLSRDDLQNIDFFVVDEFYKLDIRSGLAGGKDRSVDLNLAFHKLASSGAQFYLIGPHIDGVRGIAGKYQHVFIPSHFSTVALDVEYFSLPRDGDSRLHKLYEVISSHTGPTLVYCQSPNKCAEVAQFLIERATFPENYATKDATGWLDEEFPAEWIVTESLKRGIGIHHGNVPRAIQQYMIRAFAEKKIGIIVCTSTLIEGINTIAENVVVYDRRVNTANIDYFSYRNVAGRAGRMGEWFIGKVFVLEEPPEPTDMLIDIAVDEQPIDTPISLLLGLPEGDLSDLSRNRVENEVDGSELDIATLRENRHIEIKIQDKVAARIRSDMVYRSLLNWSHLPTTEELICACEIICQEMEASRTLSSYQIYDGRQLAAVLTRIRLSTSVKVFLEDRIASRRDGQSVSDAIDLGLKFLRSYLCFTFPRQLAAIERIHKDVSAKLGRPSSADYRHFVAMAESMFLDPNVFILDEFGIPFSLGKKLLSDSDPDETLQESVNRILMLEEIGKKLHPFEVDILESVGPSLPRG